MGTVAIVEALPFSDFLSEIDTALVGEQLAELLLVGPVRSFHLAIELRCSRFDVNMPDPLVGYVSVELPGTRVPDRFGSYESGMGTFRRRSG